jgi:peptidoglycan/LPS O-acetylase OafA/YrhL
MASEAAVPDMEAGLLAGDGMGASVADAEALAAATATAKPAPSPSSRRRDDVPALDGLRGVLCLFIVVGHMITFFVPLDRGSTDPSPLIAAFGLEYLSPVSLFVLLSGYTLTLTYDRGGDEAPFPGPGATRAFLARRWARLAAMYYASLVLALPFLWYAGSTLVWASSVAATPLMVQSLLVVANGWNAPLWTVSALALCYALFPALLRSLRARSTRALWWTAGGCYAAGLAVAGAWLAVSPASALVLHTLGPLRVPQFVMGVCAALLQRRAPPGRPHLWVAAGAGILLADVAGCAAATAATAPNWGLEMFWQYAAEWAVPPAQAALLVGLTAPGGAGGPIQRVLATRPLVALGAWSYAAYCLHLPLLLLGGFAVARGVGPASLPLVWGFGWMPYPPWAVPLLTAAVVAAAGAAHVAVEVPVTALLRGWVEGRGKAAAAAGTGKVAAGGG